MEVLQIFIECLCGNLWCAVKIVLYEMNAIEQLKEGERKPFY